MHTEEFPSLVLHRALPSVTMILEHPLRDDERAFLYMKTPHLTVVAIFSLIVTALAAEPAAWTGEYADKKFLNGQAVFQFSLTQAGKKREGGFRRRI